MVAIRDDVWKALGSEGELVLKMTKAVVNGEPVVLIVHGDVSFVAEVLLRYLSEEEKAGGEVGQGVSSYVYGLNGESQDRCSCAASASRRRSARASRRRA